VHYDTVRVRPFWFVVLAIESVALTGFIVFAYRVTGAREAAQRQALWLAIAIGVLNAVMWWWKDRRGG
jgi:hypothetical protein